MQKKLLIVAVVVPALVVGGVWWWGKQKKMEVPMVSEPQTVQDTKKDDTTTETTRFVTDVDPDVSHWHTKEQINNGGFIIKFPKEWYWLESDFKKTGYHSQIITNNPGFDMVKFADIGFGTGGSYPLTLTNNTEAIITYSVSATSDAGTPQDRIDSILKSIKQSDPSAECSISNNKTIPFTVYCFSTHDSQLQQTYHVINDEMSLAITARTTMDTLVKKDIMDKIAGSIVLKHSR